MMAVRRTSSLPTQPMTRNRFLIMSVPNDRGEEHGFRMGSIGLSIELENAMDLGDGLRVFRRTVIARRDKFASGAVEVTAPIGNHTVATIRSVATTAVTDNRVKGNSFRDRDLIDCDNETVVRGQGIHAIGKTLQLQGRRVGGEIFAQGPTDCEQPRWRSHQHRADTTDPVTGE